MKADPAPAPEIRPAPENQAYSQALRWPDPPDPGPRGTDATNSYP